MWQNIAVGVIVFLAAAYIFRRYAKALFNKNAGGCGCHSGAGGERPPRPLGPAGGGGESPCGHCTAGDCGQRR